MKHPDLRLLMLLSMGWLSILASSLVEEEAEQPAVPVTVDFTLSSDDDGFGYDIDTRTDNVSNLVLSGSYEAFIGDALSLDRATIVFDMGSRFDLGVSPKTNPETLDASAVIEISSALAYRLGSTATAGVLTSTYDGTTTTIMVVSGGVELNIGAGATQLFSWAAFDDLADDTDADVDARIVAIAYQRLADLVRAVLIAEDITRDIEDNRGMLEDSNLNIPLELVCDNVAFDGDGQSSLLWTVDAPGSGSGMVGSGDSFQARYRNCLRTGRDRYLEGNIDLRGYIPDRGDGLNTLSGEAEFSTVLIAEDMIDFNTTVSPQSPQVDGTLTFTYMETEANP